MPKKKPLIVYRSEARDTLKKDKDKIVKRVQDKKERKEAKERLANSGFDPFSESNEEVNGPRGHAYIKDDLKVKRLKRELKANKKTARKAEKIGERLTGLPPKKHKDPAKAGEKMISKNKGQLPHLLMRRELGMRGGLKPKY